jgi:hypothetical protein
MLPDDDFNRDFERHKAQCLGKVKFAGLDCHTGFRHAKLGHVTECFFMRCVGVILSVVLALLTCWPPEAIAAKHKKPDQPAIEKPIYEAPMRVVIVRNSSSACEPNCPEWIAAEGEINDATPALFRNVFRQMGKTRLPVIIRSPGGSINAALIIGQMIRDRKMTVAVGRTVFSSCSPAARTCELPAESKGIYEGYIDDDQAFCNSACPMVLSGGVARFSSNVTSIGLHEPKTTWTRQQVRYRDYYRIVNGRKKITKHEVLSRKTVYDKTTYGLDKALRRTLTDYYTLMGVDIAILDESVRAKYQDLYFLPEDMKSKLNLRTTSERASYLGNAKLCGSGTTSAVCVEDSSRDPAKVAVRRLLDVGISPNAPGMEFSLAGLEGVDCAVTCPKWIAAQGVITSKTASDFSAFQAILGGRDLTVILNSPGGDALAAINLGRMIRKAGFDTAIGHTRFTETGGAYAVSRKPRSAGIDHEAICNGVCALAFAGGMQRHVDDHTHMKVHNPALYGDGETPSLSVTMNQHFLQMGVKPDMMADMHKLRGKDAKAMSRTDLLDTALGTDVQDVTDIRWPGKCNVVARSSACFALTD